VRLCRVWGEWVIADARHVFDPTRRTINSGYYAGYPMTQYSDAGVEALRREQPEVLDLLQRATEQAVQQSALASNERAKEYLRGGVGRRRAPSSAVTGRVSARVPEGT
jgi:hypothetical protein